MANNNGYVDILVFCLALCVCISGYDRFLSFYGSYSKLIVPAIYIFGDSTVDVGTNRYLPDCGATGRFSNGNVADYIDISYLIRQFLSLSLLLIWVFYVLKISLVFINYIICISFHWCAGH